MPPAASIISEASCISSVDQPLLRVACGGKIAQSHLVAGQKGKTAQVPGIAFNSLAQLVHQGQVVGILVRQVGAGPGRGCGLGLGLAGAAAIGILGGGQAFAHRHVRRSGHALTQVEQHGTSQQGGQQQHGHQRARPALGRTAARQALVGVQHLAPDLGAQALCVLRLDHAALEVAIDFAQLVPVHAQVIGGGRFGACGGPAAPDGRQNGKGDNRGEARGKSPEHRYPPFVLT